MPNITDVAKLAQVSPMTVSRVINGTGYVKDDTRQRVLSAMRDLRYVPNSLARSLVDQKTNILGLIIPDITNPFFTTVVRGVEDYAHRSGYRVILCNSDEDFSKEYEYIDMCLRIRVDGVIIAASGDQSVKHLSTLDHYDIPYILLDRKVAGVNADVVTGDNIAAARALTQYLISLGHRRIAMITGFTTISTSSERVEGYKRTLTENGLEIDPALIREVSWMRDWQPEALDELLQAEPHITAILAGNNYLAALVYRHLQGRGIQIPQDISVACFDDRDPLSVTDPFFTAILQPAYNFGSLSAQLLFERIQGLTFPSPRQIVLQAGMAVRRSTAPPPGTDSRTK